MANYHTLAELQAKLTEQALIQASDDADAGVVDTTVTDSAAQSAQDIIDGYLRSRYSLPLESVPGIIREISLVLAIYDLFRRRMPENMPKSVREERDQAMRYLEHVADGKIALFEADKAGRFVANKTGRDRWFPDSELAKY